MHTIPNIFLLDGDGIFVDCLFSNTICAQWGSENKIIGAHVTNILPDEDARKMLMGIRKVSKASESKEINIGLRGNQGHSHANIKLMAMHNHVLGLLTEIPVWRSSQPHELARTIQERTPDFKQRTNEHLTKREWDVVRTFGSGCTNKVIGQRLGITERTVKFHFKNIFQKLQIQSRMQLASFDLLNSPAQGVPLNGFY